MHQHASKTLMAFFGIDFPGIPSHYIRLWRSKILWYTVFIFSLGGESLEQI